jgi:hypothetical protein
MMSLRDDFNVCYVKYVDKKFMLVILTKYSNFLYQFAHTMIPMHAKWINSKRYDVKWI